MHLIEQWFQVSPDNGSGAIELAYVATVVLLVLFVMIARAARVQWRHVRAAAVPPR
jgi:hypothetical protein